MEKIREEFKAQEHANELLRVLDRVIYHGTMQIERLPQAVAIVEDSLRAAYYAGRAGRSQPKPLTNCDYGTCGHLECHHGGDDR